MLTPFPVILSPYDSSWPPQAAALRKQLTTLGPSLVKTHHIGSTSVPGLVAKPIIDLLAVVSHLKILDQNRSVVEALAYQWNGEYGIAGRRFCTLTNGEGKRLAHLHFFQAGSPQIDRHLAFRDYLRTHAPIALAYETEKRRARDLHPNDSNAYNLEKAAWVEGVLTMALDWYTRL